MEARYWYGAAVLCVASFLLFMSLLLPLVVAPGLEKLPLDRYVIITSRGTGTFLSTETYAQEPPAQLAHTLTVRGDVAAGTPDVAVYDVFFSTEDVTPGIPQAERVLLAPPEERVALDRDTALPLPCCGEDPVHEGLTVQFPRGTQQRDYPLWDRPVNGARTAAFVRTERLDGTEVYLFTSRTEPTEVGRMKVSGEFAGAEEDVVDAAMLYSADREFWVEPRTGTIVRGHADVTIDLVHDGRNLGPHSTGELSWDDRTVAGELAYARRLSSLLRATSWLLPVAALALGALLLAVGIRMVARAQAGRAPAADDTVPLHLSAPPLSRSPLPPPAAPGSADTEDVTIPPDTLTSLPSRRSRRR